MKYFTICLFDLPWWSRWPLECEHPIPTGLPRLALWQGAWRWRCLVARFYWLAFVSNSVLSLISCNGFCFCIWWLSIFLFILGHLDGYVLVWKWCLVVITISPECIYLLLGFLAGISGSQIFYLWPQQKYWFHLCLYLRLGECLCGYALGGSDAFGYIAHVL